MTDSTSEQEKAERAAAILPFETARNKGRATRAAIVSVVTQADRIAMLSRARNGADRIDACYANGWCEEDYRRNKSAFVSARASVDQSDLDAAMAAATFTVAGEPVEVSPIQPDPWIEGRCRFGLSWVGQCGNTDELSPEGFCETHRHLSCVVCPGIVRAVHDCGDTIGPLVCGEPLCAEHKSCGRGT